MKTKTEKLLSKLFTGKNVPVQTIMDKIGLANPGSTINRLRDQGYNVYTNTVAGATAYRLDTKNPYID